MKTSEATAPSPSGAPRALSATIINWLIIARNAALPLIVSFLSLWVAISGLPPRKQVPHNALIVIGIVTIISGYIACRVRDRLNSEAADESINPNALPDLTGALYLAILVLVGAPAAIVFAIITPIIARAPELWRTPSAILVAFRKSMTSSIILLVCGFVYSSVSSVIPHVPTALRAHVAAAFAVSAIFLVGISIARFIPFASRQPQELMRAIRGYVTGSGLLFQVLLLSCVPLLPMTESLQPVEIEFAWVLLLTPMGAVYYLALTSARLREQTDTLRNTVDELHATRVRETELKNYAALITRAQEDERRRLARELHDDTAQALIALSRGLDALANQHIDPINSPEDLQFVDRLVDLNQRTLDSVRRACQDLRPSVLDDLGLSAALESLAGAMTERGMPCSFTEQGAAQPFPMEVEVAAYRIAQEALSNALRHSQPHRAQIELRYRPDGLRLIVSDDGRGFDVSATLAKAPGGASHSTSPENGSGLGLMGMRERAMLIGATLDIQSAPGAGTRITLDAPSSAPLTYLPDTALAGASF